MMHNNIQDKHMRLAKGDGVGELEAYYSLLGKYRGEKSLPIIIQNMKENGLLGKKLQIE